MTQPVPNRFPTRDPRNVRIAFIGDVPGEQDEAGGVPFSGFAGQLLGNALASVGLSREEVFLGNVCGVRPVGGEFSALEWTGVEVQQGVEALLRDLADYRPNLVVTLGAAPLHLFRHGNVPPKRGKMGYTWPSSVAKWRGSLFLAHESLSTVGCGVTASDADSNQSPCPGPAVAVLHSLSTLPTLPPVPKHPTKRDPHSTGGTFQWGEQGQRPGAVSAAVPCPATDGMTTECISGVPSGNLSNNPPVPVLAEALPVIICGATPQRVQSEARESTTIQQPMPSASWRPGSRAGTSATRTLAAGGSIYRYKCLATYHPSFVLRAWSKWFDLRQDVRRAREEGGTSELVLPDYEVSYGPVEGVL